VDPALSPLRRGCPGGESVAASAPVGRSPRTTLTSRRAARGQQPLPCRVAAGATALRAPPSALPGSPKPSPGSWVASSDVSTAAPATRAEPPGRHHRQPQGQHTPAKPSRRRSGSRGSYGAAGVRAAAQDRGGATTLDGSREQQPQSSTWQTSGPVCKKQQGHAISQPGLAPGGPKVVIDEGEQGPPRDQARSRQGGAKKAGGAPQTKNPRQTAPVRANTTQAESGSPKPARPRGRQAGSQPRAGHGRLEEAGASGTRCKQRSGWRRAFCELGPV